MKRNFCFSMMPLTYRGFSCRMLRLPVLFLFAFLLIDNSKAQLLPDYTVIENVDPVVLVQQYLIGQGVETSNITYTGHEFGSGRFYGESNIAIDAGVILTSGRASLSKGPNNQANATFQAGTPGDAALNQLSGSTTLDACVLEFDFVPQSNIVEFRYVFASEEYPEYANSSYNDVFGFFISGPDIYGPFPSPPGFPNGAQNIALVPQVLPPAYVSINNINHIVNSQYYVANGTGSTPNQNPYIQYDGFTTVLTARAVVIPCQTYHIKLAVADISDRSYDSGVFLEANSFNSVGVQSAVSFTHALVDTAVENCNNAALRFEISTLRSQPFVIHYELGGTAINGVDYELIADSVVIPVGSLTASVDIIPIVDDLPEPTKYIEVIYNTSFCEYIPDTALIWVKDYPEFQLLPSNPQSIECGQEVFIRAGANGGIEPWEYFWDSGNPADTTDIIRVSPLVSTDYTVQVTDECGNVVEAVIPVEVRGPVAEIAQGDEINICLYDDLELSVQGGTSWQWSTGETTQSITVSPQVNTVYTVTAYDDCGNSDQTEILVTVGLPFADAGEDQEICNGETVTLTANDTPNGTWVWTDMLSGATYNGRIVTVSPATTRDYCVTVTDNCGNVVEDCTTITLIQITADAGPDQVIAHGTNTRLTSSVAGGTPPYTYSWSPADLVTDPASFETFTHNLYSSQNFTLEVTDSRGCVSTGITVVTIEGGPLQANPVALEPIICRNESTEIRAIPGGGSNTYQTFSWTSNPPGFTSSEANPVVSPLITTVYTVEVFDGYNTASGSVTVSVNQLPVVMLAPQDDPRVLVISPVEIGLCVYDTLTLNAGNPGSTYQWSNGSTNQTIDIGTSGISFDIQTYQVMVHDPVTGCSNEGSITVYFTFQYCSYGIGEKESDDRLLVYPNPSAEGIFNFSIEGLKGEIMLDVYTAQGKLIKSEVLSITPGSTYNSSLLLSRSGNGFYYLKLSNNEVVITRKLIIQQ